MIDELINRLKENAKTTNWIYETYFRTQKPKPLTEWVRLEVVMDELQQLKQKIGEIIDQHIKAYPLDTPEDKLVAKVLGEIREELLGDKLTDEIDKKVKEMIRRTASIDLNKLIEEKE